MKGLYTFFLFSLWSTAQVTISSTCIVENKDGFSVNEDLPQNQIVLLHVSQSKSFARIFKEVDFLVRDDEFLKKEIKFNLKYNSSSDEFTLYANSKKYLKSYSFREQDESSLNVNVRGTDYNLRCYVEKNFD